MTGDGTCSAHKKVMTDKASLYATAIHRRSVWKGESGLAYNSLYLPSLGYRAPATTLTHQECYNIQKSVVDANMPKMGISRKSHRSVVFDTAQFGGLDLEHLAAYQGHSRLQYLMGHLRCNSTTGKLMRSMLDYTQLECECTGNVPEQDYGRYSRVIMTENWITGIWEHLHSCNSTLKTTAKWKPPPNRQNDVDVMEALTETEEFSAKDLKDINRCRIYLQVFYISDISTHDGQGITDWARKGRRDGGRKSSWAWPVQQRPTSWKAWELALDYLAPDGYVVPQLGDWLEQHHQHSEWYLDAEHNILYHHSTGTCEQHSAHSRARLRFTTLATTCDRPVRSSHVVEAKMRPRFVEITEKCKISQHTILDPPPLVPYTSNIGTCIEALPRHVQRIVGDIPALRTPVGWDPTTPVNIIIATDGSVTFGVGYHSWVVATEDEDILLQGGGPDDGNLYLMQSYRSELGGVSAGLAVLGTLSRSGLINIESATFLCDNESAFLSTNRPLTDSIFHRIEGGHDLVSTIKDLQENWCRGLDIPYDWAKGHADDLNRELNRAERLNVIVDEQCDLVRQQVNGPRSARSSAGLWDSETCALFIRGRKITSRMKERLTQQLLDGNLKKKEHWRTQHFESIDWANYSSAFKRLPGSLDASLHRAASWGKIRKSMERWHLPPDFWTMIEKGINHYTEQPHKRTVNSKDNEPQKPFGVTFNTPRNLHSGHNHTLAGKIFLKVESAGTG
jgi:hypothetical protein